MHKTCNNAEIHNRKADEMNKDIVSIIVPIHNSELYLETCIRSLINQTYSDIEIILIINNSKDDSEKICNKYADSDKRIKIYIDNNRGVSNARNTGLKKANGKYIFFVDSDDWIETNTIEILVKNTCKDELVGIRKKDKKKYKKTEEIYRSQEMVKKILSGKQIGTVWLYLFEKEKINMLFDCETDYLEDTLFLLEYLKNVESVKFINKKCYYYRINNNSITKGKSANRIISNIKAIDNTIKKIDEVTENKYIKTLVKRKNFMIIYELNKVINKQSFEEIHKSSTFNKIRGENIIQNKYYNSITKNNYKTFKIIKALYRVKNKLVRIITN